MTLLERDHNAPTAWFGNLPVTNRYTYGLGGERFFRAVKEEGRILGTHCPTCDWTYVPGTAFCERCLGELNEWVDVGATGEVYTYTLLFENYDGTRRETPEIVAFIQIADGGIIHRLGEVDPEEVDIGMLVEAVFKPKAKRTGAITDILHFRPL